MSLVTGMNGPDYEALDLILDTKSDTQVVMMTHALTVIQERGEEKRRRERFCVRCHKPQVHEDDYGERVCGHCKLKQPSNRKRKTQTDVVEFRGLTFVGDQFESAQQKFKRFCLSNNKMNLYYDYCRNIMR